MEIKIELENELRRFVLEKSATPYTALCAIVRKLFVTRLGARQFTVTYIDEEGDKITVGTDDELRYAYSRVAPRPLRLAVNPSADVPAMPPLPFLLQITQRPVLKPAPKPKGNVVTILEPRSIIIEHLRDHISKKSVEVRDQRKKQVREALKEKLNRHFATRPAELRCFNQLSAMGFNNVVAMANAIRFSNADITQAVAYLLQ